MPLPNQPWATSLPGGQDTVGVEQPDLTNDSAPGANDGHRVLVEHLHALRDKAQYLSTTVGDASSLPAGSLKARVTALESAPLTDINVKADATDTTPGLLSDKLDTPATGIIKVVADLGGGNRQVQLSLNFGTGAGRPVEDTDGRMTDARTPTSHASAHQNAGGDEISVAGLSGLLADGQTPLAHTSSHKHGGGDEVATATAAANAIPKAAAGGQLDIGWVPLGATAATACAGNDSRLSDARTPTSHAASHKSGGGDAIKLDELAATTDVTTLDATTGAHGLLPKLAGGTTNFLRADGSWAAPPAGSPLTTKGDLFTYDTGDQRLAVGANGTVLTADSAEATGVKWVAPSAGFESYEEEFTAAGGTETFTLANTAAVNANMLSGRTILGVYRNGVRNRYQATATTALEWDLPAGNQVRIPSLSAADIITVVYGV